MSDSQHSPKNKLVPSDTGRLQRFGSDGTFALSLFFGLGRTLQMVGPNNDTYQQQLEKFWEQVQQVCAGDSHITIKIVDRRFFINEQLCKFSQRSVSALGSIEHWNEIMLGGVEIPLNSKSGSLTAVIQAINETATGENSFINLKERLKELDLDEYRLFSKTELKKQHQPSSEERKLNRSKARSAFFQSMRIVDGTTSRFKSKGTLQARGAKRAVNTLVDLLILDESALVEMAAIKDFDDYTFAHSVNVCIYSLTIGISLNLDHKRLSQLGFSALFHDFGKVNLPPNLIKKSGIFNAEDWHLMHKHPSLGARALLKQFELESYIVRGAISAYEHHMNLDFSGYPRRGNNRPLNLFSRIITVADTFDALTSGRIYITERISPVEVLRRMLYQMDGKYDPMVLKVFINTIGLFPPGSLILLSDKRIAIVERTNAEQMGAPIVRIIGSESGMANEHELVDLSDPINSELTIARYLDAEKCNVDLKRFILEDPPTNA